VNAEKQIPEIHLPDSLHTLLPRGAASAPHFLNPGHMLRVLLGLALTLPVALGLAGCGGAASSTPTPTPTPTPTTPDARADAMIAQMTQAQELQLVQGGVTTNAHLRLHRAARRRGLRAGHSRIGYSGACTWPTAVWASAMA
jgi:hypothetical protein